MLPAQWRSNILCTFNKKQHLLSFLKKKIANERSD